MNLINTKVRHSLFGEGTIIAIKDIYMTVKFQNDEKKFIYPDAFQKFLEADDGDVQASILKEIEEAKAAAKEISRMEKAAEKAAQIEEAAQIAAQEAAKQAAPKRSGKKRAQAARPQRVAGQPMVFFVFQDETFGEESQGGYLWAPLANESGRSLHHWDRLLDVRAGDIILHNYKGTIAAISTALGEAYKHQKQDKSLAEDSWQVDGRRVDCDYIAMQRPIQTANYETDIIKLSTAKYSPYDKNGNRIGGYLFEINRELARIFVKDLANINENLIDHEVIREFLNEETPS